MSRLLKTTPCEEISKGHNEGTLPFSKVIEIMNAHEIERFHNDIVNGLRVFYAADGVITQTATHHGRTHQTTLDIELVKKALAEIDIQAIDYEEFIESIVSAGCVGYFVSAAGRSTVYLGRDNSMHIERF